jgi:hypothetical protein
VRGPVRGLFVVFVLLALVIGWAGALGAVIALAVVLVVVGFGVVLWRAL